MLKAVDYNMWKWIRAWCQMDLDIQSLTDGMHPVEGMSIQVLTGNYRNLKTLQCIKVIQGLLLATKDIICVLCYPCDACPGCSATTLPLLCRLTLRHGCYSCHEFDPAFPRGSLGLAYTCKGAVEGEGGFLGKQTETGVIEGSRRETGKRLASFVVDETAEADSYSTSDSCADPGRAAQDGGYQFRGFRDTAKFHSRPALNPLPLEARLSGSRIGALKFGGLPKAFRTRTGNPAQEVAQVGTGASYCYNSRGIAPSLLLTTVLGLKLRGSTDRILVNPAFTVEQNVSFLSEQMGKVTVVECDRLVEREPGARSSQYTQQTRSTSRPGGTNGKSYETGPQKLAAWRTTKEDYAEWRVLESLKVERLRGRGQGGHSWHDGLSTTTDVTVLNQAFLLQRLRGPAISNGGLRKLWGAGGAKLDRCTSLDRLRITNGGSFKAAWFREDTSTNNGLDDEIDESMAMMPDFLRNSTESGDENR
ncbi:hypothetical protein FA13DRAFT_1711598 [Coprinellus micaceus]|uniref:Uncharacterized protein n=1 Tax=Coprinellus micaceus TaxID=71717 RepID=A0A4Y7T4P3_COPMI|nr:hypothetical protein FA13DRAFT_1711598 [Coprinellus micaceus]